MANLTVHYICERYSVDAGNQKAQAQRAFERTEETRAANKAAGGRYDAGASEYLRAQAESVRRATVR